MNRKISLLATAVGSLPNSNPEEAINQIFSLLPDFPVWPQLKNVNIKEDMIGQVAENIPGLVFDEEDCRWYMDQNADEFFEKLEEFFMDYESIVNDHDYSLLEKYAINKDFASALPFYFEKLKQTTPIAVKGQVVGPFTFGTSLIDRENKCVYYDDTLKDILIKGLTLKALWQVVKFKEYSPKSQPVIFLDEPSISQYGTSAFITITKEDIISSIQEISAILKEHGALTGIHCCGKTDWSLILESGVDILNFDALYYAESLSLYSSAVEQFIKNGGYIAWGLIPTLDEELLKNATVDSLTQKYEDAIKFLIQKGVEKNLIINSSFITPTCGAGSLSQELANKAMQLTADVGKELQKKYLG